MGKRSPFALLLGVRRFQNSRCVSCQLQQLQPRRQRSELTKPSQNKPPTKSLRGSNGSGDENDFKPFPLMHPLGLPSPPQKGENTGKDHRTLRERRKDFVDQEKHLQRRTELTKEFSKPYFRDWLQTRHHKGKTFIAPPRLFRADKALYFPNLFGRTLRKSNPLQDTTPVLQGKISVVSVFSTLWAEKQTASFVSPRLNPTLDELIKGSGSIAQRVELNVEQNWLKSWLVRLFMGSMRKKYPQEQHGRYFLVTKGVTRTLQEQIGMMNGMVGYVYLLDEACRIRWAGSSVARPEEQTALNNGLRKLIEQKKLGTASTKSSTATVNLNPSQDKTSAAVA